MHFIVLNGSMIIHIRVYSRKDVEETGHTTF
jgi:hypothetical protein